jgi:endonuclease/exonuclease/phosphatase family metal-dependent hydrolase
LPVRKPPELLVMLAPAALVTALVLAFGFVMGGDGDAPKARSAEGSPVAGAAPEIASGEPIDSEGRSTQAKLTGPRVVIKAKPRPKFRTYKPYAFTVASFNVLGHSHTIAGGNHARYADSSTRMGWTLTGFANAGVDLVGLQEVQPQNLGALQARGGGTWSVWPGNALGRWGMANSIAWRKDTFEMVRGDTMDIPYFGGQPRMQPYILLRHLKTGQKLWVVSFHNPANHGSPGANTRYRRIATGREIALANTLARTGWPVFFTGDFNDREAIFCPLTANTRLKAANGGSTGSSCSPPDRMPVDWIFGSERLRFTSYTAIDSGIIARASDHPLVVADVRVPKEKVRIVYKKKQP